MTDLSDSKVTYSFKSDGVDAELDGKVIASGGDILEAENAAQEAIKTASEAQKVASRKTATHVTTPNGLKGKVLGRTPGLWGEEITVRMENGHITKLHTSSSNLSYSEEEKDSSSPLDRIASLVNAPVPDDSTSLRNRLANLGDVRRMASQVVSKLKHDDLHTLEGYVASAKAEELDIEQILAKREDEEVAEFIPYRPEARAFEESWLDRVAAEEAEGDKEDFDEKVATFVTALSTDTLADGSLVAQIVFDKASSESDDEGYIENFIEAAEQIRQAEHTARRESRKQARLAANELVGQASDSDIFL